MAIMVRRRSKMNSIGLERLRVLPALLLCLAACANTARLQEQAGNHTQVGTAYLGSVQYTLALKEFLAAEKLTPDDPKIHYLLGISYHGKGLSDMAIVEFQRALVLKPDDSEVHNYLGAIYLEKGRWDDAIASFNRALANILYDTPSVSLYNLGRAYYEKREYDLAMKYYRDAAEKDPDNILMTSRGEAKLADLGLAKQANDDAASAQAGQAVGPVMQGLAKPINDLSRGCQVQDIVDAYGRTGDERQGRLFREDKASRPRPAEASPPGANMTGGSAGGDFGQAQ